MNALLPGSGTGSPDDIATYAGLLIIGLGILTHWLLERRDSNR